MIAHQEVVEMFGHEEIQREMREFVDVAASVNRVVSERFQLLLNAAIDLFKLGQ